MFTVHNFYISVFIYKNYYFKTEELKLPYKFSDYKQEGIIFLQSSKIFYFQKKSLIDKVKPVLSLQYHEFGQLIVLIIQCCLLIVKVF